MRSRLAVELALALGLIACNGDLTDPGGIRGFRITTFAPANGATGVPLHAPTSVTLSADVQDSAIPIGTIRLTLDGVTVPHTLSLDLAARRVEFLAPLLPASTYRATVVADLRSSTGDSLVGPREWTFTTRAWSPVPISGIGTLGVHDATFDPDGAAHLVGEGEYYFRPGNDVGSTYVKYATCAIACLVSANWSRVAIDSTWLPGTGMGIELDGSGTVHLIHFSASPAPSPDFGPAVIRYLSCSDGCSLPGNWTGGTIDSTPELTPSWSLAGFAVSAAGQVHLLGYSAWGGTPDLRYATCSAQCTTAANWAFAPIPVAGYAAGLNSLQVDPSGRLHLLTTFDNMLTYSTCSGDCTSAGQWRSGPVLLPGELAYSASMAADAFGRVHVGYSDPGNTFRYALCTTDCTSAEAWSSIALDQGGQPGSAVAVDLMGRVVALNPIPETGELRYLSCASECLDVFSWELTTAERPDIFGSPPPGPPRLATSHRFGLRMAYNTAAQDLYFLE